MIRPIRIVKPLPEAIDSLGEHPPRLAYSSEISYEALSYLVSVARRHQNRGFSLARLVAAGEEGWQRAQRHYGANTEQFNRWSSWWAREAILEILDVPFPDEEITM